MINLPKPAVANNSLLKSIKHLQVISYNIIVLIEEKSSILHTLRVSSKEQLIKS